MHPRAFLPTLTLLAFLAPEALAAPRDAAAADRLFKEGRAAYDKGDYAAACPKFADSQKADPAPGTLLNLALCEEKIGALASAHDHVTELLPQLGAKDDRIPLAKDLLAKLDARIAQSHSEGPPEAPTVPPADTGAPPPPPDFVAPPPASSAKLRRTIGIVAGGVGVASFAVAAATGAIVAGKHSQLQKACPDPKACSPEGLKIADQAKGLLPLNTASWILGVAGVGAGAVLILTSLGAPNEPSHVGAASGPKPRAPMEPSVTPSAILLPGGGYAGLSGRF